jgi:hypothetical protein
MYLLRWNLEITLISFKLFNALAYVDSKVFSEVIITDKVNNYLAYAKLKIDAQVPVMNNMILQSLLMFNFFQNK